MLLLHGHEIFIDTSTLQADGPMECLYNFTLQLHGPMEYPYTPLRYKHMGHGMSIQLYATIAWAHGISIYTLHYKQMGQGMSIQLYATIAWAHGVRRID